MQMIFHGVCENRLSEVPTAMSGVPIYACTHCQECYMREAAGKAFFMRPLAKAVWKILAPHVPAHKRL